jgi:hypothetical protein
VMDVTKQLGRWLGALHCVRSDLCYWLMTDSGQIASTILVEYHQRGKNRITSILLFYFFCTFKCKNITKFFI